ncbi:Uncharacterised protein [Campylobacter hyointestinalis subsp. hyointestinalis]|uniref:Uncharacterized protein n=2 Tax=Campylobacter hyointestinalis TaxID=198 RepID=A0A0S4SQF9_CAMHY|nr:Uncharacterised protein [Campylobacter hyointestinalis subsp. hyointestinalis]
MTYMLMSGIKKEDTLTPINFDKWVGEYGNPSIAIENVKTSTENTALMYLLLYFLCWRRKYVSIQDR